MQSLQARIHSFQKAKRVKRNPNKKSSTTASVKWPHPLEFKANANTLAEAGFYFNPSWDDRDSVTCFLCGKELSDWDADDDPFAIHYTKCQNSCPWALVRCGLIDDVDDEGPSSKAMEKARLGTFGQNWWPHDGVAGHSATSLKMAQAGFVYTPQVAGDDTVTCLYCNLSLGGWEKEDDPIQEHHKRDSKSGDVCPFLSTSLVHHSPSRSRVVSGESNAPMNEPRRSQSPPFPNGSRASSPSTRPPSPGVPSKPNPSSFTMMPQRDPTLSTSPAGQPVVVCSQFLTPQERAMSLEQWLRQEIGLSYEKLLSDGQRQIELFKQKAAALRKCIDEL